MAPRPYWKGYLKLSLVSCAVALYPATSKGERVSFNWLNRETRNRLKQQMVDGETGEEVAREDRVRGYAVAKNDYLIIEEDDLDAVEIESSHTIDIGTFVPLSEIDPIYLDNAHYLAPNDKVAEEAFAVIRDAMAAERVVGIGRAVIARRERLLMLEPRGKGIMATVLHYNYEVRDDAAYFEDIPDVDIPREMLDLAKHIIKTKSARFDISAFEDRYENALIEMIRAKQSGRPIDTAKTDRPHNVVNLMDALRSSIAAEKAGRDRTSPDEDRKPAAKARSKAKTRAQAADEPIRKTAAVARGEPRRSSDGDIPKTSHTRKAHIPA